MRNQILLRNHDVVEGTGRRRVSIKPAVVGALSGTAVFTVLYLAHVAAGAFSAWVRTLPGETLQQATILVSTAWLLSLVFLARRRSAL